MKGQELADRIVRYVLDRKGRDITIMDLRGITSITDYFIICTVESSAQAKAITEYVAEQLDRDQIRPWHIEGTQASQWVLIDFVDVVVHIFQPETRAFYNLEKLWGDAKFIDVKDSDETSDLRAHSS
ncbi:MAG TPA: ribosome silencing factor [bacterium]|nr:ribosome silencing factor [bacterium]